MYHVNEVAKTGINNIAKYVQIFYIMIFKFDIWSFLP